MVNLRPNFSGSNGYLFVSPCPPECNFRSETKIEPDLRLGGGELGSLVVPRGGWQRGLEPSLDDRCSVAVLSSVAVWSSHLSTNRMGFYFFQSKCVVIVSSSCDFPTRGGL